jgi:hypothetical protein
MKGGAFLILLFLLICFLWGVAAIVGGIRNAVRSWFSRSETPATPIAPPIAAPIPPPAPMQASSQEHGAGFGSAASAAPKERRSGFFAFYANHPLLSLLLAPGYVLNVWQLLTEDYSWSVKAAFKLTGALLPPLGFVIGWVDFFQ